VPEYIFGHRCGCEAGVCFKLEVSQWCVRWEVGRHCNRVMFAIT
jgi:hypothetical protein